MLRHVSGLNQLTARRIVDYRKEHGPFPGRETLLEGGKSRSLVVHAPGGFSEDYQREPRPLDRTWNLHPESYAAL